MEVQFVPAPAKYRIHWTFIWNIKKNKYTRTFRQNVTPGVNLYHGWNHKVRLYKEYKSVCPLIGIATLPTPLSPASVPLPPEPGGGAHSPAGEGLGESQFRRLEKSFALCLLCGWNSLGGGSSLRCKMAKINKLPTMHTINGQIGRYWGGGGEGGSCLQRPMNRLYMGVEGREVNTADKV
jgi:hypothetical protein